MFLVFLGSVLGFLNFRNNFWNLLKKLGRVYFLHFFKKIIHYLGFWYFGGYFFSWFFVILNFQNNCSNLL